VAVDLVERADRTELVWRRALALTEASAHNDPLAVAVAIFQTSRHEPVVLRRAARLGQERAAAAPDDREVVEGSRVIDVAAALLDGRLA
jgi:hypothetical protein